MCIVAGNAIGDRNAFFLAFVRQHRAAHHITHRPDILDAGGAMVVDLNEFSLVEFYASALAQQSLCVGPTSHGNNDLVYRQRLLALGVGVAHGHAILASNRGAHFGAQANIQPESLEVLAGFSRDLRIGHRQQRLQGFERDHFSAQAAPDTAEFQTNDTGTDHAQAFRHGLKFQRAPRVDDRLAIEGQRFQFGRHRTAGEYHVTRLDLRDLAVMCGQFHDAIRQQSALAKECCDSSCLQQ